MCKELVSLAAISISANLIKDSSITYTAVSFRSVMLKYNLNRHDIEEILFTDRCTQDELVIAQFYRPLIQNKQPVEWINKYTLLLL